MDTTLKVEDLHKRFGQVEVLKGVSLSANTGDVIAMIGSSGSGKSTLSLVAAMNGFNIIADDAVLVENQTVFALYSRAKIEESNSFTSRYLENSFRLMNNTEAKQILPLCSLESGFEFSARVKNIVFPTRSEQSQLYSANYEKFKQLFLDNSLREIFGGDKNNSIRHSQIYDSFQNFELKASIDMERNLKLLSGLLST
jgi:ABC-type cobalamin/Fe3+-siderophores transport system ATPase subunit